jgi:hypothetical protein
MTTTSDVITGRVRLPRNLAAHIVGSIHDDEIYNRDFWWPMGWYRLPGRSMTFRWRAPLRPGEATKPAW